MGRFEDKPAVHQHAAVGLHRREHAGRRQAGAHRGSQVAVIEDHALAGDDVGGDGAKRDGEVVEALDLRHGQRQRAQHLRELLALHQAARQPEPAALQTRAET